MSVSAGAGTVQPQAVVPGGSLAASAQLTQAYRAGAPFSVGGQVASAFNPQSGSTELFVLGTGGTVFNLVPDATSDTGWSVTDLHFPAAAARIAAGTNSDGTLTVFGVDTTNTIYSYGKGGTARAVWQAYPLGSYRPDPSDPNAIADLQVGYDKDGVAVPAVMMLWAHGSSGMMASFLQFTAPSAPDAGTRIRGNTLGSVALKGLPGGLRDVVWSPAFLIRELTPAVNRFADDRYAGFIATSCPPVTAPTAGLDAWVWGYDPANPANAAVVAAESGRRYSALSVTEAAGVLPWVVAVDAADGAVYKLFYDAVPAGIAAWEASKLATGPAVTAVAAHTDSANNLAVFALGTDTFLYHVVPDAERADGVGALVRVSDTAFTALVPGRNPAFESEVFAVTADNLVYHVWRPDSTADWNVDQVTVPAPGKTERIDAYSVLLTVYDQRTIPASNVQVTISSNEAVDVDINGQVHFIDATHPWTGPTNVLGQVVANVATNALGVPVLTVSTPLTAPVEVDPAGGVQARLTGITSTELTQARMTADDGTSSPLLSTSQAQDNADHLASAITKTMNVADGALARTRAPATGTLHPANDARIATLADLSSAIPGRTIDASTLAPHQFRVSLGPDGVRYTDLTTAQAASVRAEYGLFSALSSIWGDISWGDVFSAIKSGAAAVADFVVDVATTVADAVTAGLQVVVEGVTYVYNTVVGAVEQLFDLIEEVFKDVALGFEELFRWLGTVFDWPSILRTKEMIKTSVEMMLTFTADLAPIGASFTHNQLQSWADMIPPQFDAVIKDYLGGDAVTLDQFRASRPAVPAGPAEYVRDAMGSNVAHHAVVNALGGPPSGQPPAVAAPVAQAPDPPSTLSDAMAALTNAANTFHASDAFDAAVADFESLSGNPDQVLDRAMAGVLRLIEAMVLAGLAGADVVVQALAKAVVDGIDEIKEQLGNPLPEIPVLSDLYEDVSGSPLSVLDCMALILAIPTNVVHNIVYDEAPFPDKASLDRFTATFTAPVLLQRSGLATRAADPADPPPTPDSDDWVRAQRQPSRSSVSSTTSCGSASTPSSTSTRRTRRWPPEHHRHCRWWRAGLDRRCRHDRFRQLVGRGQRLPVVEHRAGRQARAAATSSAGSCNHPVRPDRGRCRLDVDRTAEGFRGPSSPGWTAPWGPTSPSSWCVVNLALTITWMVISLQDEKTRTSSRSPRASSAPCPARSRCCAPSPSPPRPPTSRSCSSSSWTSSATPSPLAEHRIGGDRAGPSSPRRRRGLQDRRGPAGRPAGARRHGTRCRRTGHRRGRLTSSPALPGRVQSPDRRRVHHQRPQRRRIARQFDLSAPTVRRRARLAKSS